MPVSIHQPSSTSLRTTWPWSISHWMASVISSSPRAEGWMARTASWIVLVEQVHADQGQVGGGHVRLLDQPDDLAVVVELGHAEALRVGHLGQQDLGAGTASACRRGSGGRARLALGLEAVDERP